MYVAIEGNQVITYGTTLADIYWTILKPRLEKNGQLYLNGKLYPMTYNMKQFSASHALDDFFQQHAHKCIPKRVGIYKSI